MTHYCMHSSLSVKVNVALTVAALSAISIVLAVGDRVQTSVPPSKRRHFLNGIALYIVLQLRPLSFTVRARLSRLALIPAERPKGARLLEPTD